MRKIYTQRGGLEYIKLICVDGHSAIQTRVEVVFWWVVMCERILRCKINSEFFSISLWIIHTREVNDCCNEINNLNQVLSRQWFAFMQPEIFKCKIFNWSLSRVSISTITNIVTSPFIILYFFSFPTIENSISISIPDYPLSSLLLVISFQSSKIISPIASINMFNTSSHILVIAQIFHLKNNVMYRHFICVYPAD